MVDTTKDGDLFDSAKSSFLRKEDVAGCLVSFQGLADVEQFNTTNDGKDSTYDVVRGCLVVIQGRVSDAFIEEHGEKLPVFMDEFLISGVKLIDNAKASYKKGRPRLGRLKQVPNKKGGKSFILEEPTDKDLVMARDAKVRPLIQRQIEMWHEATDPFDDSDTGEAPF